MGIFYFYNQKKRRTFNYQPLYHDPKKVEMEKRIRKIQRELDGDTSEISLEDYKDRLEGAISNQSKHLKRSYNKGETKQKRSQKNWWLILIVVLLIVLYYVLYLI